MRTLKKTLCLVLCLAMMVGLCAMATSAVTIDDYKDKKDIQYEDAVTLLSALGVLEGYPDESFQPKGELNRAEGAAIMTRLLTKSTPTGTSSFTDMGNYAWAQPYVKFCEDYGIIHGYNDGTFKPADKLKTVDFAKMLICALGYDAKTEGFVDTPAYGINVTKKVTGLNLADGLLGYDPNGNVTRETAAQLAFNTLFQTMVYADGSSYQINFIGDAAFGAYVSLKSGAPVPNTSYDYNPAAPDNVMQFIEAAYPSVKVHYEDDAYAVPMAYWYQTKNAQDKTFAWSKVIAETYDCDVLAVYNEGIALKSGRTIYSDACFSGAYYQYPDLYENGERVGVIEIANSASALPLMNYGGAEALLIDIDDDGVADRLVVKYPYLAKVIAVQEDPDEETRSISLKIFVEPDAAVVATVECDEFEQNDYVLVYAYGAIFSDAAADIIGTKDYDGDDFADLMIEIKAADSKNGTLTKVTLARDGKTASALTVGGDPFTIGSRYLANLGPADKKPVACDKDFYELQVGMTAYTNFGYVLGVISDAEAYGDYVFVVASGDKSETSAFGVFTEYAGYVKQDATPVEAVIGNKGGSADVAPMTWYYPIVGKASTRFINGLVTVADIDGLYRNTPALDSTYKIVTDAKTNFILWTEYGFEAYTGIKNVPEYKDTLKAYALVPSEGGHAVAVFIDTQIGGYGTTPREFYMPINGGGAPIYIVSELAKTKEVDADGATQVYTYSALIDGKLTTVKSLINVTDVLDGFGFVIPYYDAKGYISSVKVLAEGEGTVQLLKRSVELADYKDGTLTLNGDAYFVCSDTAVVYVINSRGTSVTKITPESLTGLKDAYISAISVSALDRTLQIVYFDKYNFPRA